MRESACNGVVERIYARVGGNGCVRGMNVNKTMVGI